MKLEQAARQALEALEMYNEHGAILRPLKTTNALREALADQAKQKPVSMKMVDWHMNPMTGEVFIPVKQHDWPESDDHKRQLVEGQRKWLAEQAEQKPVAWVEVERGIPMFMNFTEDYKPYINNGIAPLYAAPVRTKDLTDEEITNEWESMGRGLGKYTEFARAVIAADREKNK